MPFRFHVFRVVRRFSGNDLSKVRCNANLVNIK